MQRLDVDRQGLTQGVAAGPGHRADGMPRIERLHEQDGLIRGEGKAVDHLDLVEAGQTVDVVERCSPITTPMTAPTTTKVNTNNPTIQ